MIWEETDEEKEHHRLMNGERCPRCGEFGERHQGWCDLRLDDLTDQDGEPKELDFE